MDTNFSHIKAVINGMNFAVVIFRCIFHVVFSIKWLSSWMFPQLDWRSWDCGTAPPHLRQSQPLERQLGSTVPITKLDLIVFKDEKWHFSKWSTGPTEIVSGHFLSRILLFSGQWRLNTQHDHNLRQKNRYWQYQRDFALIQQHNCMFEEHLFYGLFGDLIKSLVNEWKWMPVICIHKDAYRWSIRIQQGITYNIHRGFSCFLLSCSRAQGLSYDFQGNHEIYYENQLAKNCESQQCKRTLHGFVTAETLALSSQSDK